MNANKIDGGRIVLVSAVLEQKHADIEDLFADEDYLDLYNAAFGKSIKAEDLPSHHERILKRLEGMGDPKFDHWRPAAVLLRDPSRVEKHLGCNPGQLRSARQEDQCHPRVTGCCE